MNHPLESNHTNPHLPCPWHQAAWTLLNRSWDTQRFPHAILLHGVPGLGKKLLAQWFAQALLCEDRVEGLRSCGKCPSCKLNQAGSHPDLILVSPEEDKQQISVDQIRATNESLSLTSTRSGFRVAIIEPAHQMTIAAANSLLKTLEEPNKNTVIIMVTSHAASLLPTLRSRCQQIGIAVPGTSSAQAWLEQQTGKAVLPEVLSYSGGAPLRAMEFAQGTFEALRQSMLPGLSALTDGNADLTQLAQAWADEQLPERLRWLDYWLSRLIRQEILRTADPVTSGTLHGAQQVLNISAMYRALDKLRELSERLRRTALQPELALMSILMRIHQSLHARN